MNPPLLLLLTPMRFLQHFLHDLFFVPQLFDDIFLFVQTFLELIIFLLFRIVFESFFGCLCHLHNLFLVLLDYFILFLNFRLVVTLYLYLVFFQFKDLA
jgi:hypothetical protein